MLSSNMSGAVSRCGIILQARMGSTRLPGKVLKMLSTRPMLEWVLRRLDGCAGVDQLIVATSEEDSEAPLVELVETLGFAVFRGDEQDVLDRYYRCAQAFELDVVVRATADNPFVDRASCEHLIELLRTNNVEYACAFPSFGCGLPVGTGLEAMTFSALEISWKEGNEPHHREHVNELILEQPERFGRAVLQVADHLRSPELVLTVDTAEQFARAEQIYRAYMQAHDDDMVVLAWVMAHLCKSVEDERQS